MEVINDLMNHEPHYENIASFYINNPHKTSYLLVLANDKAEKTKELYHDLSHQIFLLIALISDYMKGIYRDVSIKTIVLAISTIVYFVYPKKTFLDSVPGVKFLKQAALVKAMVHALQAELIKYEEFKKSPIQEIEV